MSAKAAVALLAAATLAFEILLVRALAVEHFHHVAYMAIGVAMLGIGASGTAVAARGGIGAATARRWFPFITILTALALVLTPALVDRVPLDLTQLAWNAEQWPRLAAVYVLWGSTYYAIVVALPGYPPFLLTAVRMAIAASTTSGADTEKSGRWCSPTPMKARPT